MFARFILALLAVTVLAACYPEPVAIATFPPTPIRTPTPLPTDSPTANPTTIPSATIPPTPDITAPPTQRPLAGGPPSPGCINGWTRPEPGSQEFDTGLDILAGYMGQPGPWDVAEMRYFTGPDAPGIIEPRFDNMERWYLRAGLVDDPSFRARWLIEKRTELILGVSAVAPWDSTGYQSPDWTGFIGEGEPQSYVGLPGEWSGIPFDFVTGEGDGGQPGLPPEVVDCLAVA